MTTIVTEVKPTGFRWKNAGKEKDAFFSNGVVTWKARGIKATSLPK
jgi:hypothetical protein